MDDAQSAVTHRFQNGKKQHELSHTANLSCLKKKLLLYVKKHRQNG